jgi:hypothetical protein
MSAALTESVLTVCFVRRRLSASGDSVSGGGVHRALTLRITDSRPENDTMSKTTNKTEPLHQLSPKRGGCSRASACSAAARKKLMDAEAVLMKAATEFAYQWGRDQTLHPKMYWLELHLENWGKLARAALGYSECVEPPNEKGQR